MARGGSLDLGAAFGANREDRKMFEGTLAAQDTLEFVASAAFDGSIDLDVVTLKQIQGGYGMLRCTNNARKVQFSDFYSYRYDHGVQTGSVFDLIVSDGIIEKSGSAGIK